MYCVFSKGRRSNAGWTRAAASVEDVVVLDDKNELAWGGFLGMVSSRTAWVRQGSGMDLPLSIVRDIKSAVSEAGNVVFERADFRPLAYKSSSLKASMQGELRTSSLLHLLIFISYPVFTLRELKQAFLDAEHVERIHKIAIASDIYDGLGDSATKFLTFYDRLSGILRKPESLTHFTLALAEDGE